MLVGLLESHMRVKLCMAYRRLLVVLQHLSKQVMLCHRSVERFLKTRNATTLFWTADRWGKSAGGKTLLNNTSSQKYQKLLKSMRHFEFLYGWCPVTLVWKWMNEWVMFFHHYYHLIGKSEILQLLSACLSDTCRKSLLHVGIGSETKLWGDHSVLTKKCVYNQKVQ